MLIAVSCAVATLSLLGVLLVSHSTANTIKDMPELHDPRQPLTAFPANMEQILAQQAPAPIALAGAASLAGLLPDAQIDTDGDGVQDSPDPAAGIPDLRSALAAAADQLGSSADPELQQVVLQLQQVLVEGQPSEIDEANRSLLREAGLEQLTAADGSVMLPDFNLLLPENRSELSAEQIELASQLDMLQDSINAQVAALPELAGREFATAPLDLTADPGQLASAVAAVGAELEMFGLEVPPSLKFDALSGLGDALLQDHGMTLEGLDLAELEEVTRMLMQDLDLSSAS